MVKYFLNRYPIFWKKSLNCSEENAIGYFVVNNIGLICLGISHWRKYKGIFICVLWYQSNDSKTNLFTLQRILMKLKCVECCSENMDLYIVFYGWHNELYTQTTISEKSIPLPDISWPFKCISGNTSIWWIYMVENIFDDPAHFASRRGIGHLSCDVSYWHALQNYFCTVEMNLVTIYLVCIYVFTYTTKSVSSQPFHTQSIVPL